MLLVDDLAAGGTKNLRHTPRGLVTLNLIKENLAIANKNIFKTVPAHIRGFGSLI